MEPGAIFSSRNTGLKAGPGPGRDEIAGRLADHVPISAPDDPQSRRGDHSLNPGTYPQRRLTPAAVLVALVERPLGLTVLLTERTAHLVHHPGQVSFPGGHVDAVDEGSPERAALRETEEEVGIPASRIEILGRLDEYVTRTGFLVTPVVGVVTPPFPVRPDPHEVAEVFEVPLAFLLDPANHRRHSRMFEGRERFFHAMPYERHMIWGATAGMLMNLIEVLSVPAVPSEPSCEVSCAPSSNT